MSNDVMQRLYSGKSVAIGEFDSQLVEGRKVVILAKVRPNKKTGLMIQLAFLDTSINQRKIDPTIPNGQGCDQTCTAFAACYVQALPFHIGAISRTLDEYNQGLIPTMNLDVFLAYVESCGIPVRFGEFGDPASVELGLIEQIAQAAKSGWTGYSHQWRTCDQRLQRFVMASVENESDYRLAKSMGWRCFYVNGSPDQSENRIECLNTSKGLLCADCRLCRGTTFKMDIVIPSHGRNSKKIGVNV